MAKSTLILASGIILAAIVGVFLQYLTITKVPPVVVIPPGTEIPAGAPGGGHPGGGAPSGGGAPK